MALQGWRLFGVMATIIIYIGGVLFLSMNNMPGSHPKRMRIERFAEFSNFHSLKYPSSSRRMVINWCREPRYLNGELPPRQKYINRHTAAAEKKPDLANSKLLGSSSLNAAIEASKQDMLVNHKINYHANMLTALASFPGSGNTWLRYLIQQSTGILTGSIYKDYGLLKTGFPAENVCNNSVLLVKTHEWGAKAWEPFSRAILLVRDPEKAILAEFNRQGGGHVGFASPDRYKRTKGKYWQQFVINKLKGWELMNLNWARNFTGNVKVVFYDNLVNNLEVVLRDILNFLEFPIDENLLKCALTRREGIFRRKKRMLNFDPYTAAMREQIKERREIVYSILKRLE